MNVPGTTKQGCDYCTKTKQNPNRQRSKMEKVTVENLREVDRKLKFLFETQYGIRKRYFIFIVCRAIDKMKKRNQIVNVESVMGELRSNRYRLESKFDTVIRKMIEEIIITSG